MTDSTTADGSSDPNANPEALIEGQRVAQASDMESSADSDVSGESTASQTLDAQSEDEKDRADRHY